MRTMLSCVFAMLLLGSVAFAAPGIPNRFHGYVAFIDGPAPDGSIVDARIDGVMVVSATTLDGKYGYSPNVFDVTDPDNTLTGKTISFFVNGVDTGETAVFANGASTELDLTVDNRINKDTGMNRIIASSSTETAGKTAHPANATNSVCISNWFCKDWSPCSNKTQARSCIDINNCVSKTSSPILSQDCTDPAISKDGEPSLISGNITSVIYKEKQAGTPTGRLSLVASNSARIVGALFIIIIAFWYARKKQLF